MRLLVLEDERRLCQAYARRLRRDGHAVDEVATLADARRAVGDVDYDCLVLDRHVPGGDSITLVAELAESAHRAPVVIVSADGDADARVLGLSEGADDYVPKPVRLDELALRVGNVLARRDAAGPAPAVELGAVRVDLARREVTRDGTSVRLTPVQYAVFEQLVINRARMLTSQELLDRCWDRERDPISNPLHTQISRLRKLFDGALRFVSVHGAGYRLEVISGVGDGHHAEAPPAGAPPGTDRWPAAGPAAS
jgi:two-component system, OmpR family, response regulator